MRYVIVILSVFVFVFLRGQQADTIVMDEVVISADRAPVLFRESARVLTVIQREEIEKMSANSLGEILESLSSPDIRQRGSYGVQGDLSIRGGSFDQNIILLNGVNISDAQTGHHNLDLPVDPDEIERIEILEGAGARLYGTNAFSGAINIITRDSHQSKIGMEVGKNNYKKASLGFGFVRPKGRHKAAFSYQSSDGYVNNTDFRLMNFYYSSRLNYNKFYLDFQTGNTDKAFGANQFYTAVFPEQYEKTNTLFSNLQIRTKSKTTKVFNLFWRRHQDRFELFRNKPDAWYKGHNYHLTNALGSNFSIFVASRLGRTSLGYNFRYDLIWSNVLGELMSRMIRVPFEEDAFYTRTKSRWGGNLFVEHTYSYKRCFLSGGVSMDWNSFSGWNMSPGVNVSCRLTHDTKIFASINKALRLPTFTDLYYHSPLHLGNATLKPEKALSVEMGVKYFRPLVNAHIVVFRRYAKDVIDWVKRVDSLPWQAENITQLTTSGFEISIYKKIRNTTVRASYAYVTTDKDSHEYISKYALDYLKHKATLMIQQKFFTHFFVSLQGIVQDRAGTFDLYANGTYSTFEYEAFLLINSKIGWRRKNVEVYCDIHNILNTSYYDIGNVIMPGRIFQIGGAWKF